MEKEKLFKIFYGDNDDEYITRYLKDEHVLNGYLSESKAFDIFYNSMILCNNYLQNNYEELDYLIDSYDEENDYYIDEYQFFIIQPEFNEELTIKATKKMDNTLYYDNKLDLYITGVTDLGTSRTIVSTDIKVEEIK